MTALLLASVAAALAARPCPPGDLVTLPTAARTLSHAGLTWRLRDSDTPTGAGPSLWSAGPDHAWVDGDGLHLRLDPEGPVGAEALADLPRPPRRLRFSTRIASGPLSEAVVAAVFLYRDDACETDLELSRWGDPQAASAQYALAGPDGAVVHRFELDPTVAAEHELTWRRGRLRWTTWVDGRRVARWTVRGRRAPPRAEVRLHANLWVAGGAAVVDPVELVIDLR